MMTASSVYKLHQIEERAAVAGRRARVHLKIDTGMERIGTHWDTAHRLLEAAAHAKHCDVAGVFFAPGAGRCGRPGVYAPPTRTFFGEYGVF